MRSPAPGAIREAGAELHGFLGAGFHGGMAWHPAQSVLYIKHEHDHSRPHRRTVAGPLFGGARAIAAIMEADAGKEAPLNLSSEEERLLERARDDFRHGRALDADEYHAGMSAFMQRLAAKAAS